MDHRHLIRAAVVIAAILVIVLAAIWWGQRRLIYFPDRTAPAPDRRAETVTLHTGDGLRLSASLVRPAGPDRRVAVLVTHGNAGHRGHRMPLATALAAEGLTVLLVDYRGYGGNPGSPSEAGLTADARAARAYLEGAGFSPARTVYFGESLGAAVAARLAAEHPPAALVLRSPFRDLAQVARHHYPWLPVRALLRDRFRVDAVEVPTTVVYGSADTIVPPEFSRDVTGNVRYVELPGADHNDADLSYGPQVVAAVVDAADRITR